jgi:hypothetical protein
MKKNVKIVHFPIDSVPKPIERLILGGFKIENIALKRGKIGSFILIKSLGYHSYKFFLRYLQD